MNSVLAIGLMSGTSMDGVDAALIETDGEDMVRPLAFVSQPYADTERDVLRAAMGRALSMAAPAVHPEIAEARSIVDRPHIEGTGSAWGRERGGKSVSNAVVGGVLKK